MTNIIYTKTKIRVFPDMGELDSNLSSMENKQMMKEFLLREENITISQFLHEIFPLKELFQNISSSRMGSNKLYDNNFQFSEEDDDSVEAK